MYGAESPDRSDVLAVPKLCWLRRERRVPFGFLAYGCYGIEHAFSGSLGTPMAAVGDCSALPRRSQLQRQPQIRTGISGLLLRSLKTPYGAPARDDTGGLGGPSSLAPSSGFNGICLPYTCLRAGPLGSCVNRSHPRSLTTAVHAEVHAAGDGLVTLHNYFWAL